MRFRILVALLFISPYVFGQGYNFNCTKDTSVVGCASSCITLKAVVPDLKSSTSDYIVNRVNPTGGCYLPPVPPNDIAGASANLTVDDRYSSVIGIGFPFTFFGTTYTQLVISANGYISFDVTRATRFSHFGIIRQGTPTSPFLGSGAGTPEDLPSVLYDKALIMGPYHDLDPSKTTSPDRKLQYQVFGTAPYRRWVLSFYKIPLFSNNSSIACNSFIENTHQIVLYESTGVIEIYIQDMEVCTAWNQGRAMIGIQDVNKTKAFMAPGRKASDPPWGSIGMKEVWRFTPAAGSSLFKRAELYNTSGSLISTATAPNAVNGDLELSFPNVCSPLGTSSFVVKSVYAKMDNPGIEISTYDTIRVSKTEAIINGTVTTQPSLCSPATGEIHITPTDGVSPFQYAVTGRGFTPSSSFTDLYAGNYQVTIQDATGCSKILTTTIPLINNLSLQTMNDTTICAGASFVARTTSNGEFFQWTPATWVSDGSLKEPLLQPARTTLYEVQAKLGTCIAKDSLLVTVNPAPEVNAGADRTIIVGDVIQLNATAANGSYLWTPATGLSSATILDPTASPAATTTYTLRVTDAKGCTATDQMTINVFPNCVKPKEAFTPNGDGINDVWTVTNGSCTNSIALHVFNRYGSTVYSSTAYNNDWDGTFKGERLPDGTYYYIITIHLVNGKTTTIKGNVTLLR
jgi:gliding motility-associated-like protein